MLVIVGRVYHSTTLSHVECLARAKIVVENQVIVELKPTSQTVEQITAEYPRAEVRMLKDSQFVIPGLIDTHIHAPQYVFTGTGYHLPLLQWLNTYTFPKEAQFQDKMYAAEAYKKVVRKTLKNGTTTACYYGTTHLESNLVLAETVVKCGQRAFIGKVNMDRNSPEYYNETTEESISSTLQFVERIKALDSDLITAILTPRFVPSCTPELMQFLGKLAKKESLPIQSHLSETPAELLWVKELHPKIQNYSSVYREYGLLTSNTIMAHCVHLSKQERDMLRDIGTSISHCPSSNFCLSSGVLNVRRLIDEGHTKIGLGTDVAGGYSPSILDAIRQSIIASQTVFINSRDSQETSPGSQYLPLNFKEAFYLATLGGAKCMNLDTKLGNFIPGKIFDAVFVDTTGIDIFDHDDPMSIFEKFVYLADDRNVNEVFVNGKSVFQA